MQQLAKFKNNDILYRNGNAVVLLFKGKRKVLSTAHLNGGYREDLYGVFNMDEKDAIGKRCEMLADTYEEHLKILADTYLKDELLGEKEDFIEHIAGLTTAVDIENTVVRQYSDSDYTVTAIVTAGAEGNPIRAGESIRWREEEGYFYEIEPGTINITLHIDTNMQPGAMATAMMVATEAKASVLRDRNIKSRLIDEIATGTGTDGVIVIADAENPKMHHYAATYSKMGECIGRAVRDAMNEALTLHMKSIGHL